MWQTFVRFGLWIVLLVLATYVVRETFSASAGAEILSDIMLQRIGSFGLILLALGGVSFIMEKAFSKTKFRHCAMCRQPVAKGEIYCRPHLRQVIEREADLTRRTRVR